MAVKLRHVKIEPNDNTDSVSKCLSLSSMWKPGPSRLNVHLESDPPLLPHDKEVQGLHPIQATCDKSHFSSHIPKVTLIRIVACMNSRSYLEGRKCPGMS